MNCVSVDTATRTIRGITRRCRGRSVSGRISDGGAGTCPVHLSPFGWAASLSSPIWFIVQTSSRLAPALFVSDWPLSQEVGAPYTQLRSNLERQLLTMASLTLVR
jgi:hypothetical protein